MPEKQGADYEHARWHATPLLEAQFYMMNEVMRRFVLPHVSSATVILEVGPGPGTWTKKLLEENGRASYTLLDISREMLARAKETLAAHSITYKEGDFTELSLSEPVDFFFSSRAIEYMKNKEQVARTLSDMLAPGGVGVVITKMPKKLFNTLCGRKLSALHQGQIAPHELKRTLAQHGLKVVLLRVATATVPILQSPSLNKIAFNMLVHIPLVMPFTAFAESYVMVFKKRV